MRLTVLIRRVSPWSRNEIKRLIKTSKLHSIDSGLLGAIVGLTSAQILKDRQKFGALLETFVFSEAAKLAGWADGNYTFHHYRDKDQDEIDIIVEDESGALIAIEVKASATVRTADFECVRKLMNLCGDGFKLGVVLYDGAKTVLFGDRLFAAPISCLWN